MVTATGGARQRMATGVALLVLLVAGSQVVVAGAPQPGSTGATSAVAAPVPAAPAAEVSVTPAGAVNPAQPLVVHIANGRALRVAVTDAATGHRVGGMLAPDGATWTSVDPLAYARHYAALRADAFGRDR